MLYDQLKGQPAADSAIALVHGTRGPLLPHEQRELFELTYFLEIEGAIKPLSRRPASWRKVLNSQYPRYRRDPISDHAEFVRYDEGTDAQQLLVVFTGETGGLFMSMPRLLLMLSEPRCDLLWLQPPESGDYTSGVPGYAESFASLCAKLRQQRSAYERITAIGASLGGYTALRAAILADMDAAVSFSGRFSAPRRWLHRPQLGAFDPLCACTRTRPRLTAYYGARNEKDTAHAARLVHMCPDVDLVPIESHEHNVVAALAAQRRLSAVFHELV